VIVKSLVKIICLFVCVSVTVNAEQTWELRKDKDNIQVHTRKVEGSPYDAVMASTVVANIRLSSLVALLQDLDACPDWADRCVEAYVFKQITPTEAYVYSHNDLPFPVKDRDALTHVTWRQDPETFEVTMLSSATTGKLPKVKGRLRLTEAKTSWRFTPLPDQKVKVINEAHINPGSSLPGWVSNMLLVDTPHKTVSSFVTEASKAKYRDAIIGFVKEPPVGQSNTPQ